ncbi:MAG TPA: alkaline phosphatase family protein, partial [Polyangia bacterium]
MASTIGVCASLAVVFFSHHSPKSLTPLTDHNPPLTEKLLLIVVDALRADTALDGSRMPQLAAAAKRGASGVAMTTPLTMTIPGLRALGCGTSSDYLDLFENWGAGVTNQPNLLANLKSAGFGTGLIGDDAWARLYRPWLDTSQTEVNLSGFEYYLHAMDKPDEVHFERAQRSLAAAHPPCFLIVHFVGLDHAGHKLGPQSEVYASLARRMDEKIAGLMRAVDSETTVLVTSDHAMTNRGGHGGGDLEARQTPIVMLGKGIRPTAGLDIEQVDLAATMAVLLGVPIPAQSIGRIVHQALDTSDQQLEAALQQNRNQLLHLLKATYPTRWEKRLGDARQRTNIAGLGQGALQGLSPASRQAIETTVTIQQTIDKRDWDDRLQVVPWLLVAFLLCVWQWIWINREGEPTGAWAILGCAASILIAAFAGLAFPPARFVLGMGACVSMSGLIAFHLRSGFRLRPLLRASLAMPALAILSALIVVGRVHQYRADTMFGDVHDAVAVSLGWACFLAGAFLHALQRKYRPDQPPLPPWGRLALAVLLFCLMGFGGRPLALASFGGLALLTWCWNSTRTSGSPGGGILAIKPSLRLKTAAALLLLGLASFLAIYARSYYLLGWIKWNEP